MGSLDSSPKFTRSKGVNIVQILTLTRSNRRLRHGNNTSSEDGERSQIESERGVKLGVKMVREVDCERRVWQRRWPREEQRSHRQEEKKR